MNRYIATAAFLLGIAVAFGAFGAHALKARLAPEALAQWNTGVQYQFIHALGMLAVIAVAGHMDPRRVRWTLVLFLAGIILFSGSLYLLSTRELLGTGGLTPVIGPITPLGGLAFIAGWMLLLITALRKR